MDVKSSNIASVDHDGKNLTVVFKTGKSYTYSDVPRGTYDKLLSSDSIGKFFHSQIRPNYKASLNE